jgi:RNA polymerase sigma factor (sigma-70 family)
MTASALHGRWSPTRPGELQDPLSRLTSEEEGDLRRRLTRWAVRFLELPEAEFADAYQGAWRKLLEGRRNGRSVRNLEHALRWAIHNCWLEECRRRRRRPTVPLGEGTPDDFPRGGAEPVEQLEQLEAARTLFEAARNLDEISWRMVLLRDIWGLSPAEVCDTLGVAGRTYRRKHARALMAIHSRLAPALADAACGDRRRTLMAVAAGTASTRELEEVDRHVRRCISCRRTLTAMKRESAGSPSNDSRGLGRAGHPDAERRDELSAAA